MGHTDIIIGMKFTKDNQFFISASRNGFFIIIFKYVLNFI